MAQMGGRARRRGGCTDPSSLSRVVVRGACLPASQGDGESERGLHCCAMSRHVACVLASEFECRRSSATRQRGEGHQSPNSGTELQLFTIPPGAPGHLPPPRR